MAHLIKCTRCRLELELKCYSVNNKGSYYKSCDKCRKQIQEYHQRDAIKEKHNQYYLENTEKKLAQGKAWRQANKEYLSEVLACDKCGCKVSRDNMLRHTKSAKCAQIAELIHKARHV